MLPGEVSRSRVHLLYSHPRKGNRDSANFAMRMSEIPNGPHRGLLREVGTGLKALFRSLECHQIHALKRPLAIFQTVSLGCSVNKPLSSESSEDSSILHH